MATTPCAKGVVRFIYTKSDSFCRVWTGPIRIKTIRIGTLRVYENIILPLTTGYKLLY